MYYTLCASVTYTQHTKTTLKRNDNNKNDPRENTTWNATFQIEKYLHVGYIMNCSLLSSEVPSL